MSRKKIKLSNKEIEQIAVNAIETRKIKEGAYLDIDIPVGDKGISFDGKIIVYNDNSEKKDSYLNDIPAQSKGTTQIKGNGKFSQGKRSFQLDLDDYRNYYKRGGCLLFVVEVDKESMDTKIFYKYLLPLDLIEIISTYGHQNTYSVEVSPLEGIALYTICRKFMDQREKQPIHLLENPPLKIGEYDSELFTSITFDPTKESIKNLFKHGFYYYGIKNNAHIPISTVNLIGIGKEDHEQIQIGEQIFFMNVYTHHEQDKIIKKIEESLELTFFEKKKKKNLTFSISKCNSLQSQLKILPLLIAFLETGEIKFRNIHGKKTISKKDIKILLDLRKTYALFVELKKVFSELHLDEDLSFGDEKKIFEQIQMINQMVLHNEVRIKEPESARFVGFFIGDIYLLLFYNPFGVKKFINAFSKEMGKISIIGEDPITGESVQLSPFILLTQTMLSGAKNFNIATVMESFNSIPFTELAFGLVNQFCLRCLNAFDETQRNEFLELPHLLLEKLSSVTSNFDELNIIYINLCQIKLRQFNELDQEDEKELMKRKNNQGSSIESLELRLCISILLQSKREAKMLFEELSIEKQEFYKTLPIYTLYNQLLS